VTPSAPALPQGGEDPHVFYQALLANRPVGSLPGGGGLVLVRHADVADVIRRADHWVDPRWVADRARTDPTGVMRGLPGHARFRRLVLPRLGHRSLQRHVAAIERRVAGVIDRAGEASSVEVSTDLAAPIALGAIAEVLALHDAAPSLLARLDRIATSAREFRPTGTFDPIGSEVEHLDADLRATIRRGGARDDLTAGLLGSGSGLTEEHVVAILRVLIVAGLAPFTNMIGNAIVTLVQRPGWAETIGRSDDAATTAVEELLRWDPPIHLLSRVVTTDCVVAGRPVREGDALIAVVAAANRDGARFRAADRLQLARRPNPHLSFGLGDHACPGAALVRLVLGGVVRQLAARWREATIMGQPRYATAAGPRGLRAAVLSPRRSSS
jgi:cytochrome P450